MYTYERLGELGLMHYKFKHSLCIWRLDSAVDSNKLIHFSQICVNMFAVLRRAGLKILLYIRPKPIVRCRMNPTPVGYNRAWRSMIVCVGCLIDHCSLVYLCACDGWWCVVQFVILLLLPKIKFVCHRVLHPCILLNGALCVTTMNVSLFFYQMRSEDFHSSET